MFESPEQAIDLGQRILSAEGLTSKGKPAFGWNQKSIGRIVEDESGRTYWARIICRGRGKYNERIWNGDADAKHFDVTAKPELHRIIDKNIDDLICRIALYEYVPQNAVSEQPYVEDYPAGVDAKWMQDLSSSLDQLSSTHTERVNTRQDLITRRIKERWPETENTAVGNWITVHGDLHWANLTVSPLKILDWEGWGIGPAGLDPAFLLCFSVLVPELVTDLRAVFAEQLNTPDGQLSQLFAIAELLRMTELHGDHPQLVPGLTDFARHLLVLR